MLTLKLFETVKDTLAYGFLGLWAFIDGIIYRLVSLFFKLFYALAEVQLLDNSIYRAIADRVYLFVGIIALFSLSIALLKSLVNPDEINKGVIKSFKSMIMSVALVILTPTIFTYAFSLQAAILDDNIIGKIFQIDLNKYKENGESEIVSSENSMHEICNFEENESKQVSVLDSSGNTISGDREITHNECQGNYITLTVLEAFFSPYSYSIINTYGTTWEEARKYMVYTGNFDYITTFSKNAYDEAEENSISYSVIISTVAAAFLIYVLLSFSIDLGVRCAKLAFYQLIAPIPVLMKMIPGKEGQFEKWSKAAIATFLEVFVRLIVIEFIIFMCSNLFSIIDSMNGFSSVGLIGKAVLAMGLFAFAKQAPKLLGEALGFEAGNLRLGWKGFKEKLSDGGFFAAAGAIGGAATAGMRNLTHGAAGAIDAWKKHPWNGNASDIKPAMKAMGRTFKVPFSSAGGAISGFWRGAKGGYDSKGFGDLPGATGKAVEAAIEKRNKRESYRSNHTGSMAINHAKDLGSSIKSWATGSSAKAVDKVNSAQELKDLYGEFESLFSGPAYTQKKNQLSEYKALKAAGVTTKDGENIDTLIKRLEGSMLGDRIKSITKNTNGYAYSLKQIADYAKKKPDLMSEIGIDSKIMDQMSKYRIRGNEIVDNAGNSITAENLINMYEGSSVDSTGSNFGMGNISYSSTDEKFYYGGKEVTSEEMGSFIANKNKDGYADQKSKASSAIDEGKTSIEYKEAIKKQNEKK